METEVTKANLGDTLIPDVVKEATGNPKALYKAVQKELDKADRAKAKAPKKVKPKAEKKAKPAKAPAKKATKAAKPKKEKPNTVNLSEKTKDSEALASLKKHLLEHPVKGTCAIKGCGKKTATPRSLYCWPDKKEIRKEQLRLNNIEWRKRLSKGKAKHHIVYRGRPTIWASEHKTEAKKLAKAGHGITPPEKIETILAKTPGLLKSKKKSAAA